MVKKQIESFWSFSQYFSVKISHLKHFRQTHEQKVEFAYTGQAPYIDHWEFVLKEEWNVSKTLSFVVNLLESMQDHAFSL